MPLSHQELEYFLPKALTRAQLAMIGEKCIGKWKDRVIATLPDNTLRESYLAQLTYWVSEAGDSVTFGLPGGLGDGSVQASIAENGMSAHDMNDYLTKNGKTSWTRMSKKGKMHTVHSKLGKVAFIPMEKSQATIAEQTRSTTGQRVASERDVRAVLDAIKNLTETKNHPTVPGKMLWGQRLAQDFGKKLKPTHITDVLFGSYNTEGVYSKNAAGEVIKQAKPATLFRTVTEHGKRWHRMATEGAHIAEKVYAIDLPDVIREVLSP